MVYPQEEESTFPGATLCHIVFYVAFPQIIAMFCGKQKQNDSPDSDQAQTSSKSKMGIAAVTGSIGAFCICVTQPLTFGAFRNRIAKLPTSGQNFYLRLILSIGGFH